MSKTRYLNLDEVAPPKYAVTLGGKSYPIKQMSLGDFIDVVRGTSELDNQGEQTPLSEIELMQKTTKQLQGLLPTMPEEVLLGLTMEQLGAIMEFIQSIGEIGAEVARATAPSAEGDAGNAEVASGS